MRDVRRQWDDFARSNQFATGVPEGGTGWTSIITKTAGSPTAGCVSSDTGQCVLATDATNELQVVRLAQNDVLPFNVNNLLSYSFTFSVSGVDAQTTFGIGLGTAGNNTLTSITSRMLLLINGGTSLTAAVLNCSDGTTTFSNVATGLTIPASTLKQFVISFEFGLGDVRFFLFDANGRLTRIAATTKFNFAAWTSSTKIQPIISIGKASGTGTPAVQLDRVDWSTRFAA